ncbi:MAG TPA: hypothetical protein VFD39_04825, partial [Trueperaceae bacterium]|nr:hypothetical protein [Trueperaceae bacterium]
MVLDTFEHLSEQARLLDQLLATAAELQLLVTSVQSLGLEEEWVVSVPGLSDPERSGDDAALQLFAERARQVDASFELSGRDTAQVAAICRLTGGNPLAIELAAGWVTVMPVASIAAEVARGLDILEAADRQAGARHAGGRHASIRTVFERSWTLLEENERGCLRRLTVFRGGFDLAAAKGVAGAGFKELAALCRKSMVAKSLDGRFEIPEILRTFVVEGMAGFEVQLRPIRARHAAQVLDTVLEASRHVNEAYGGASLERLDQDRANIAAAMTWALDERRYEMLADFVEAQANYWVRRGLLDLAGRWYTALESLEVGVVEPRRLANVLRQHAFVSFVRFDFDTPLELLQLSLELCRGAGDAEGEARTYAMLGIRAVYLCDYAAARARYLEALGLGHEHGLDDVVARALNNLGDVHRFEGDFDRAWAYYEESLALERDLGDLQMVSNVLGSLGVVRADTGPAGRRRGRPAREPAPHRRPRHNLQPQ